MRRVGLATMMAVVLGCAGAEASDAERGWSWLVEKLAHDGVPRDDAVRVFRDDRVEPFDGLNFSLHPRESPALYRHLRTFRTADAARRCIAEYAPAFADAERRYGVPANVVASIIQVESGCGRNTGRSRILPALARLAMAAEPENLMRNVERHTLLDGTEGARLARWRADALEDMFYPEVKATFMIADRLHTDPLEIRGSGSGAFGIPQFLPQSYLWFGVDGDGDGTVSLYDPDDAIPSCARYLQHYGWRSGIGDRAQRNVIWGYNHSDAYIDTVLWLADTIEVAPHTAARAHSAKKRTTTASRRKAPRRTASTSSHRS